MASKYAQAIDSCVEGIEQLKEELAKRAELTREVATKEDIGIITAELAVLKTLVQTTSERCPYRETIQKASNNRTRLEKVEEKLDKAAEKEETKREAIRDQVTANRLSIVKIVTMLVCSGGVGGGLVALAQQVFGGS